MMRRPILVLTVCAMLATLLIVGVAPAIAQNRNNNNNDDDIIIVRGDRDDDDFGGRRFFNDANNNVEQGFEQEAESGDVDLEFSTENTGDNSNVCAPALQFGNTGNVQNAQGVLQYGSSADDIEFEGSSVTFEPSLETDCEQAVQQSSAASSN